NPANVDLCKLIIHALKLLSCKNGRSAIMKQEVTKRLLVKRSGNINMNYRCAVIATLRLFATKWKPCIICYLAEQPMRYNDLYRIIPNISRKILSEHLKELEFDRIVARKQYDEKLQRVEY